MAKNFAADSLLYKAFLFELDLILQTTSSYALAADTPLASAGGAIYRIKNEGRIPSPRTVEQTLLSRIPLAARWLTGDLRRALDCSSSHEVLIEDRQELLARCGACTQDLEKWRFAGLEVMPGYFARFAQVALLEKFILELGSLRGLKSKAAPGWYVQCWVLRNTLAELGRHEPAFALIEQECTSHVINTLFPQFKEAWCYAKTDEFTDHHGMCPWPRFIDPVELIALYDTDEPGGKNPSVPAYMPGSSWPDDEEPTF